MFNPEAVPGLDPDAPPAPPSSGALDWITRSTRRDRTVISAIPSGFARYATLVIPEEDEAMTRADAALIEVLQTHTPAQPWWLGYLDTGLADLVDPDAPRASAYEGWSYALLQGGPQQALNSRSNGDSTPWHTALPELIFPSDRSWLVSTMWDDDWRCLGGPAALVDALTLRPELEARPVMPDDDATPPGFDRE